MIRFATHLLLFLSLLSPLVTTHAASNNDTAQAGQRNWQLGVSLGYGTRSNPLIDADDLTLVAVIDASWYGERVFFDNGDLGFTFQDNPRYTLNGVLRANTERLFFEQADSLLVSFTTSVGQGASGDGPVQDGVDGNPNTGLDGSDPDGGSTDSGQDSETIEIPKRRYAVEAGIEFLTDGRWGFLQTSVTQDISNRHEGFEANLTLGRSGHWRRMTWTVSAGLSYRSDNLNDYYYGVLSDESQTNLPAYRADDGINYHAAALLRYYLTRSLSLGLVVEYERLSSAIANSPFVADDRVITSYGGIKYTF